MRLAAVTRFVPLVVTLSVGLAVAFSFAALILAFDLRKETKGTPSRKFASAGVMGIAVSAMHYTGMASASFVPSAVAPDLSHAVSISTLGAIGIGDVTLIVLALAVFMCSVDRRRAAQAEELEHRVVERTRELTAIYEQLRNEMLERQRAEVSLHETQAELAHITRVLAMGELVAAIAHEINQPLAAVVINANFCLRQLASGTPNLEGLREAMAEIVNDGAPGERRDFANSCAVRSPEIRFPCGPIWLLICHTRPATGCNCSRS
jgi:signal transduction histidine kinase